MTLNFKITRYSNFNLKIIKIKIKIPNFNLNNNL